MAMVRRKRCQRPAGGAASTGNWAIYKRHVALAFLALLSLAGILSCEMMAEYVLGDHVFAMIVALTAVLICVSLCTSLRVTR